MDNIDKLLQNGNLSRDRQRELLEKSFIAYPNLSRMNVADLIDNNMIGDFMYLFDMEYIKPVKVGQYYPFTSLERPFLVSFLERTEEEIDVLIKPSGIKVITGYHIEGERWNG